MKPHIILSTPRTSSTLVSMAVASYFKNKYKDKFSWLGYFLNENNYNSFYTDIYDDSGICIGRKPHSVYADKSYRNVPRIDYNDKIYINKMYKNIILPDELLETETVRRVNLLKKYNNFKYVFKCHITKHTNLYLEYIKNNNCIIIATERKNKLNQLLSYYLAKKIGIFNLTNQQMFNYPNKKSIYLQKELINSFAANLRMYNQTINSINNKSVLVYEDTSNINEIFNSIGLYDWATYVDETIFAEPKGPDETNLYDYFKNLSQIKDWFENSYMS